MDKSIVDEIFETQNLIAFFVDVLSQEMVKIWYFEECPVSWNQTRNEMDERIKYGFGVVREYHS